MLKSKSPNLYQMVQQLTGDQLKQEHCKIITDLTDKECLFKVKCRGQKLAVFSAQEPVTLKIGEKQDSDSMSRFSALKGKHTNKNKTNKQTKPTEEPPEARQGSVLCSILLLKLHNL